jgi:peptidyl-tRNA hydrolase
MRNINIYTDKTVGKSSFERIRIGIKNAEIPMKKQAEY